MKLNLKRPIIFFDLETTGVDTARDRIVEISMIKVMPDGEEITRTRRLNPGMHIPEEATAVHGITDDDVRDCPTFAQVAKSLEQFIRGCDFGGFNSNRFDLPVLVEEFLRAGVDVDLKRRKFVVSPVSDETESLLELLGAKITLTTDTGINIIRRGEPESLRLLKRFNINQQIGISELGILLGE